MSATATVLEPNTVSADDVELFPLGHRQTTGNHEEEPDSTQRSEAPGRDWKFLFQLVSCGVSFFVAGVNDGSLGALLPYIIRSYGLTTAIASSVSVETTMPIVYI